MYTAYVRRRRFLSHIGRFLLLLGGLGAALTALSPPSQAAMRTLTVAELVQQADTIVLGTVLEQVSAWNATHTSITTDVTLAVERVLAGAPGARVTLQVEGGIVGGMGMRTSNDATFTPAERVLVFLDTHQVPSRLVGLKQGKFAVQDSQANGLGETWELDTLLARIRTVGR